MHELVECITQTLVTIIEELQAKESSKFYFSTHIDNLVHKSKKIKIRDLSFTVMPVLMETVPSHDLPSDEQHSLSILDLG